MIVGERVYWRAMYGQLCSGVILEIDHSKIVFSEPSPYRTLPDGCEFSMWMHGSGFMRLPEFAEYHL